MLKLDRSHEEAAIMMAYCLGAIVLMGCSLLLTLLRVLGLIHWAWYWLTLPIWLMPALYGLLLIGMGLLALLNVFIVLLKPTVSNQHPRSHE